MKTKYLGNSKRQCNEIVQTTNYQIIEQPLIGLLFLSSQFIFVKIIDCLFFLWNKGGDCEFKQWFYFLLYPLRLIFSQWERFKSTLYNLQPLALHVLLRQQCTNNLHLSIHFLEERLNQQYYFHSLSCLSYAIFPVLARRKA